MPAVFLRFPFVQTMSKIVDNSEEENAAHIVYLSENEVQEENSYEK